MPERGGGRQDEADDEAIRHRLVDVDSTWPQAIGYDPETRRLYVKFKSDVICRYSDVGAEFHARFMRATSKGKFVHAHMMDMDYKIMT